MDGLDLQRRFFPERSTLIQRGNGPFPSLDQQLISEPFNDLLGYTGIRETSIMKEVLHGDVTG